MRILVTGGLGWTAAAIVAELEGAGHSAVLFDLPAAPGTPSQDIEQILTWALYHDISEVITGDLATPIKTFNPQIETAFRQLEGMANRRLLDMLPEELQSEYGFLGEAAGDDPDFWELIKAADLISSYIKCVSEIKMGNAEFAKAAESIKQRIDALELPEVGYFMERFMPSFSLTLDELN